MNIKFSGAVIGAVLLMGAAATCNGSASNDDATLLGLTALALQPVVQGSPEARSAAAAAINVANGTAQAGSTPANFALNAIEPKQLLAIARNRLIARQLSVRPQSIPTAMTCADGTCDFNGDEVVNGTFNCAGGGTATANGVTLHRTNAFPNLDITVDGSYTFNACKQLGMDYGSLPVVGYRNFTLSGDLTLDYAASGTISGDATTVHGVVTAQGSLQSDGLTVDGANHAFDITVASQDTSHGDYSQAQSADPRIIFTLNGNVSISGTVDGESVVIKTPYSGVVVCRTSGTSIICQ